MFYKINNIFESNEMIVFIVHAGRKLKVYDHFLENKVLIEF